MKLRKPIPYRKGPTERPQRIIRDGVHSAWSLRDEFETRQPTIQRDNTSTTKATYTKPTQVATYVMSVTQSWLGRVAVDEVRRAACRIAGNGRDPPRAITDGAAPCRHQPLDRVAGNRNPSRTNWRHTFSAPYTAKFSSKT